MRNNQYGAITPKKTISRDGRALLSNKDDNDTTSIKDLLPPFL